MIRLIFKTVSKFAESPAGGAGWEPYQKRGGAGVGYRKRGPSGKWVYKKGGAPGGGAQAAPAAGGGAPAAPVAKTVITPKGEETVAPKPKEQKAIDGMRDEMAKLHGKPQPKEGGDPAAAAVAKEEKPASEAPKRERYARKDGKIGERWKVGNSWRYGKTAMEPEEGELERLKGAKAAKPKAAPKKAAAPKAAKPRVTIGKAKAESPAPPAEKAKGNIPGLVDDAWHEQQKKKLLDAKAKEKEAPSEPAVPANPKPHIGSAEPIVKQPAAPAPEAKAKPTTKPGELPAPLKALADAAHDPAALRKVAEGHANNLEAHDAIADALQGKHGEDVQRAVESVYGDNKNLKLVPKMEAIGQALKGAGTQKEAAPEAKPAEKPAVPAPESAKPDESARQKELADLIASQKADMDADKPKKSRIRIGNPKPAGDAAPKSTPKIFPASMDEIAKMRREHASSDKGGGDYFALPKSGPAPKVTNAAKVKTWGFQPEAMAKELSSDDLAELRRQVTGGVYPKDRLGAVDAAIKMKAMPNAKAAPMPSAAQKTEPQKPQEPNPSAAVAKPSHAASQAKSLSQMKVSELEAHVQELGRKKREGTITPQESSELAAADKEYSRRAQEQNAKAWKTAEKMQADKKKNSSQPAPSEATQPSKGDGSQDQAYQKYKQRAQEKAQTPLSYGKWVEVNHRLDGIVAEASKPSAAQDTPKLSPYQQQKAKKKAKLEADRAADKEVQRQRAERISDGWATTNPDTRKPIAPVATPAQQPSKPSAAEKAPAAQQPPKEPGNVGADATWALHSWGWRGGKAKEVADTLAKHKGDPQYLQKVFDEMKSRNASKSGGMPPEAIAEVAKILKDKYGVRVA